MKKNEKERQDILKLCLPTNLISLEPRLGSDANSTLVLKMLFEGLLYREMDGQIVPAVAERYTISPDQKTYMFYLRKTQWSNGLPVTAYDFEYAWKKVIDHNQKFRSSAIHHFYVIRNVACYLKGVCELEDVGVKALDDLTLKVELESPASYFLEAVTNASFFPICKQVDTTHSNWFFEEGQGFVCNGPFTLVENRYDNEIILRKNFLFWDEKHVQLSAIKIYVIKDPYTRLSLFEKREVHWVGQPFGRLLIDAIAQLKKDHKLVIVPTLGIYWYVFNTERAPFNSVKMRKAFSYALNRKEITDHVLQQGELPAMGIFPSPFGFQNKPYFEDHNTIRARDLFAEALSDLGIKSDQLPEITLSINSDEMHAKIAEVIRQQLFQVLGVKVRLKSTEWKVHYNNLLQGDFSLGGMAWHSWLRDPIYTLQAFVHKNDGINMSRWENIEYQNLIQRSDETIDKETRREILHRAEELLLEELPVLPVYYTTIAFAKAPTLHGEILSELYLVDFRHAYFAEEAE